MLRAEAAKGGRRVPGRCVARLWPIWPGVAVLVGVLLGPVVAPALPGSPLHLEAQVSGEAATTQADEPRATWATRSAAVDQLFQPWDRPDSPGAAVLVSLEGETVHLGTYGSAELEHGVPIRPATVFDAASVAKMATGMAVAMLVEEGRISPEDEVARYIPELPDFGHPITIRNLVHHTSGLRDWPGALALAGWDLSDVLSYDHILEMVFRQRELNFPPGEDFAYSNTGYNLLAEIVGRVTGRPFHLWVEEEIFEPLGMHDTRFHHDHRELVPNRARSYVPGVGRFIEVPSHLTAVGSSSLMTTAQDMGRWLANFDDPRIGGPHVIERMHEPGSLNRGESVAYGWGLDLDVYRGTPVVGHGGSWAGYRASVVRLPEHGLGIAILANDGNLNPRLLARRIADIYVGDLLPPPGSDGTARPNEPGSRLPTLSGVGWWPEPEELADYEGTFRSPELGGTYELVRGDRRLFARHARTGSQALHPVAPDRFQGGWFGEVRFERDPEGNVVAFTATSHRVRNLRFERVP